MTEDRHRVLEMLKTGKISVAEAEELLDATRTAPESPAAEPKPKPKYLKVVVVNDKDDRVNIGIPLGLIRSGIKLGAFIPKEARVKITEALNAKGVDFDLANLDSRGVGELIEGLADMNINVEGNGKSVRIFCE